MAFCVYDDNLYHYIPGSGGIHDCRELKSEFVQELIFGEGSTQIPDSKQISDWAEDNIYLELKYRLHDANSVRVYPVWGDGWFNMPTSWKYTP